MSAIEHDKDYYAWTQQQAEFLRQRRFADLDIDYLSEELESMGASDRRELMSRLTVLLTHLLKWQDQPDRRGTRWRLTITEQRRSIRRLLADSPSLQPLLPGILVEEYRDARDDAIYETSLAKSRFPLDCPYSIEQVLNSEFWPD